MLSHRLKIRLKILTYTMYSLAIRSSYLLKFPQLLDILCSYNCWVLKNEILLFRQLIHQGDKHVLHHKHKINFKSITYLFYYFITNISDFLQTGYQWHKTRSSFSIDDEVSLFYWFCTYLTSNCSATATIIFTQYVQYTII